MTTALAGNQGRPRLLPVAALGVVALVTGALGVWQVKRLAWKEALIAHTTAAVHAPPVALASLPRPDARPAEYRRVAASGRFLPATTTLVTAASELGNGYWDMVVLDGAAGPLWVNRGFVPMGSKPAAIAAATPTGAISLAGLVRVDEPKGSFLRANHPELSRWYSRDLAAMNARAHAAARTDIFIDAQSETPAPKPGLATTPTPGLTVISFPNNHLGYAITWFTLCLLSLGAAFWLPRQRD